LLRLTSLLTGKAVAQVELLRSEAGNAQRGDPNLRGVPAGQYAAAVLVDGVPVATQKVIINH
jgi:hypothetical protein